MTFAYQQKEPEKFATFLKRQKMIFIVAFLGYVCAYLVRNNFKLMSKSISDQRLGKSGYCDVTFLFNHFLRLGKILYGRIGRSCRFT